VRICGLDSVRDVRVRAVAAVGVLATVGIVLAVTLSGSKQTPAPNFSIGELPVTLGYKPVANGAELVIHGGRENAAAPITEADVTVVNLWAQWCDACQAEGGVLKRADPILRRRGVGIVGVDSEDTESKGAAYARQHGWSWPQYFDLNGATLHDNHLAGLPDTFITRDGRIVGYFLGPISSVSALVDAVSQATGHSPSAPIAHRSPSLRSS
jgi:thiol-disulfide isomerase/thioredoxin